MKYELLKVLSFFISFTPWSGLRVFLYRVIFGYDLLNTYLGYGTRIYCQSFTAHNCRFGPFNSFVGPFSISFGDTCTIARKNRFFCDEFAVNSTKFEYQRIAIIGDGCNISSEHHIDLAGKLVIGSNSWLGGAGTQIWTHGPGRKERQVKIGSNCYIGSATLIGPGAMIGDWTMVGMGGCVTQSFQNTHQLIGGVPAKVIREEFNWKTWQINGNN